MARPRSEHHGDEELSVAPSGRLAEPPRGVYNPALQQAREAQARLDIPV